MARFIVAAIGALATLYLVLVATAPDGAPVAVGLAMVLAIAVISLAAWGAERVGGALVAAAFLFAPIFSGPFGFSWGQLSDVFLAAGFLALLPTLLQKPLRLPPPYLVAVFLMLGTGLLSMPLSEFPSVGVIRYVSLLITVVALPVLVLWWRPPRRVINVLAGAYVAGQTVSMIGPILAGNTSTDRMAGLTTHPNAFGTCAVFAIGLIVYLYPEVSQRRRWLLLAVAALQVFGVIFSGGRAALVALALLSVVVAIRERSGKLLYAGAAIVVGLVTAGPLLFSSLGEDTAPVRLVNPEASTAAGSDTERESLLSDGVEDYLESPIIGSGFGGAETWFYHNTVLQWAVAAGVLGALGWLILLFTLGRPVFGHGSLHRLAYPAIGYLVTSQFSPTITVRWIWIALALALLAYLADEIDAEAQEDGGGADSLSDAAASAAAGPPSPVPRP